MFKAKINGYPYFRQVSVPSKELQKEIHGVCLKYYVILNNHKALSLMVINFFLLAIFSIQGTSIPSPSPRFTAFPMTTTTTHLAYGLARKKNRRSFWQTFHFWR